MHTYIHAYIHVCMCSTALREVSKRESVFFSICGICRPNFKSTMNSVNNEVVKLYDSRSKVAIATSLVL